MKSKLKSLVLNKYVIFDLSSTIVNLHLLSTLAPVASDTAGTD